MLSTEISLDALGRRLAKTANGVVTTFVHDGAQVIAEYEAPLLTSADIGAPALAGSFSDNGAGTITLAAGGTDIWGTSDQFRYAYGSLTGDGTIRVRVTSQTNTDGWAKAGVMLRESLAPNARHVLLAVSPSNGVVLASRATTGGSTVNNVVTAGVVAPVWLALQRSGSTVYAYRSVDGNAWTSVGSIAFAFPATPIFAGLAVTSHNAAAISTMTGTNLLIEGAVATSTSPIIARSYVYGSYVDEPLALITPTAKYYYHANHLYSVAALTNATGAVVERNRYDTYGQRTVLEPDGVTPRAASSYNQQVGFTGRYLDKETGLYYFRARYYSGTLGRFISRDQFGRVMGAIYAVDIADHLKVMLLNTVNIIAGREYVGGMGLYSAKFIPGGLDPSGYIGSPVFSPGGMTILMEAIAQGAGYLTAKEWAATAIAAVVALLAKKEADCWSKATTHCEWCCCFLPWIISTDAAAKSDWDKVKFGTQDAAHFETQWKMNQVERTKDWAEGICAKCGNEHLFGLLAILLMMTAVFFRREIKTIRKQKHNL